MYQLNPNPINVLKFDGTNHNECIEFCNAGRNAYIALDEKGNKVREFITPTQFVTGKYIIISNKFKSSFCNIGSFITKDSKGECNVISEKELEEKYIKC